MTHWRHGLVVVLMLGYATAALAGSAPYDKCVVQTGEDQIGGGTEDNPTGSCSDKFYVLNEVSYNPTRVVTKEKIVVSVATPSNPCSDDVLKETQAEKELSMMAQQLKDQGSCSDVEVQVE